MCFAYSYGKRVEFIEKLRVAVRRIRGKSLAGELDK